MSCSPKLHMKATRTHDNVTLRLIVIPIFCVHPKLALTSSPTKNPFGITFFSLLVLLDSFAGRCLLDCKVMFT